MYNIKIGSNKLPLEKILDLYTSVGWTAYTDNPEQLMTAINNSTYVVSVTEDDKIIGLARSISDDISIHYLQDILIHSGYQKKGIGRLLLENCLERFKHVRTHMILTDDEERQQKFYESLGYINTKSLKKIPLNCYVKMKNIVLE